MLRAALIVFTCTTVIQAASPVITGTTPFGAQRGTEVELKITGERLADVQQILWYSPGIEVKDLAADPGNFVKARVAIGADCPPGPHAFRVRTASGISNLRTFSVGVFPDVAEVEPNTDFAKPQPVPLNSTINGVIENEDVDYFLIESRKDQRINLEIEGLRLGYYFFDPYIAVLNMQQFELAHSDDTSIARQDAACAFIAPADGTYVVQVRESVFRGNGNCKYRLHVGTFPRPTAAIPFGGKPGEAVDIRWLGDPAGEFVQQVTLPGTPLRQFGVLACDGTGTAPLPTPFVINDLPGMTEAEPNNNQKEATAISLPCAVHGILREANDTDFFKFSATRGQVLDVRVLSRQLGSPLDSVISVAKVGGGGLGGNDDNAGSPDSYQRVTIPDDGEYVVQIHDQLKRGGADYAYRLEIAAPKPRFSTTLPEHVQFTDTTVPVPRGGRYAILAGVTREDFGAEVRLELANLPPGVQVAIDTIPAGSQTVPVLITAAADAPLEGRLIDVIGRSTDPNLPLEGHLVQRTSLVRGDNNRDIWHCDTDRMALAVTEEAPFSIEVIEPKCPLVRGGSMNLKVIATRKEGFKAPIGLKFLYAPPGVSINNSISIAEGQTEALVPITADSRAQLSTWKVALLGEANGGNGAIVVSTQLASLTVSEPFVAFQFQPASVEQEQTTNLAIRVEKLKDWEGPAQVELLGLPNEVTTEAQEITATTTELIFPLKTTLKSPPGLHKTLFCRATIMVNGEPVVHGLGGGELRINVPLPSKANQPAKPADAAPPAEKPLSRLEQLRQQQTQP